METKPNGDGHALILQLATDIVASYASNNLLPSTDLPGLIHGVYNALNNAHLGEGKSQSSDLKPAVPIKKSIGREHIICLEDGKKLKMLKRYISTRYNLTPDAYRAKWGLPADYPMVAPAYAEKRSAFAKKIGLGKKQTKKSK